VLLTVAVKVCGSPSGTDAAAGATVTITEGGGGGGPTSPPQPSKDATRSSARRHRNEVPNKVRRPRSFVLPSIAAAIARVVPVWSTEKKMFPAEFAARVCSFNGFRQSSGHLCVADLRFSGFTERMDCLRSRFHSAEKLIECRVGKNNRET
jgi:hypothetical protein